MSSQSRLCSSLAALCHDPLSLLQRLRFQNQLLAILRLESPPEGFQNAGGTVLQKVGRSSGRSHQLPPMTPRLSAPLAPRPSPGSARSSCIGSGRCPWRDRGLSGIFEAAAIPVLFDQRDLLLHPQLPPR